MMYTLILVVTHILSVVIICGIVRFRPSAMWRLYPIVAVGLFSFVPALALGREMFLGTDVSNLLSAVPIWMPATIAVLFTSGIIPLRRWIRQDVLDRTAEFARRFLDELPGKVMAIEAAESRGDITIEDTSARRAQIQRDVDRIGAIDGCSRFLHVLLKIQMLRLVLQVVGGVVLGIWSKGLGVRESVVITGAAVGIDVLFIFLPYLLLFGAAVSLLTATFGPQSRSGSSPAQT